MSDSVAGSVVVTGKFSNNIHPNKDLIQHFGADSGAVAFRGFERFERLFNDLTLALTKHGHQVRTPKEWRRELQIGSTAGVVFSKACKEWYESYVLEDGETPKRTYKVGVADIIEALYLPGEHPLLEAFAKAAAALEKAQTNHAAELAELSADAQGKIHELEKKITEQDKVISALRSDFQQMDEHNDGLNYDNSNLVSMLGDRNEEVGELRGTITELQGQITALKNTVDDLRYEVPIENLKSTGKPQLLTADDAKDTDAGEVVPNEDMKVSGYEEDG